MTDIRHLTPDEFPGVLRELPQPPKRLSVRGALPQAGARILAVVGARRHTSYGRDACERIVSGLSGSGIIIVSGLALGIDAIAHEAAMDSGLMTVAFPGSGLRDDVLYPATNRVLARHIIERGGGLVSEFPDDLRAAPYTFPQRNRLMAGIADGILVIEAEVPSGTLITSRLATEYNKDVFAVPGSIFAATAAGPHMLIKAGAIPVTDASDILCHWNLEHEDRQTSVPPEDCTPEELAILNALREPLSKDDLAIALDLPIHELNITLSILEIKGLVEERLGKIGRAH